MVCLRQTTEAQSEVKAYAASGAAIFRRAEADVPIGASAFFL